MARRRIHGATVRGVDVGPETRCAHYGGERDVIAVRFACCGTYYPCFRCHAEVADHEAERWSREALDRPVVLCGVCGARHRWETYLAADSACPDCGAAFNPGCESHRDRYVTP